jgi:hypothetical protein
VATVIVPIPGEDSRIAAHAALSAPARSPGWLSSGSQSARVSRPSSALVSLSCSVARRIDLNAQAKSAARSAFESTKQRFYNHLLTAMKTPTLIKCIERDQEAGHAAVVRLVSTGEALMERCLADIPVRRWASNPRSTPGPG